MLFEWQMIAFSLFAVALLLLVVHFARQTARLREKSQEQDKLLETLIQDFRAMTTAAIGVDERIIRAEKRIRRLLERQEQLETSHTASRPYDHAIRMVQKGATAEDIMSVCELSRGEAELLVMMHSMDKAS